MVARFSTEKPHQMYKSASADVSPAEEFILEFTNDIVMSEYTPNKLQEASQRRGHHCQLNRIILRRPG